MRDRGGGMGRARSCDGILYASTKRSKAVLWYLRPNSVAPHRALTFPRGVTPLSAEIAPNGRTVAVEVERPEQRARPGMAAFSRTTFAASATRQVVVVDLPVRGRPDVIARFAGSAPSWSRDGRRLAFERGAAVLVASSAAWEEVEFVAWGRDPAWSPAGNVLALVWGGYKRSAIHLLTVHGETRLPHDGRIDEDPVWSPDGRRIVFGRKKRAGGWPDLWIVAVDGGGARRLTHYNHYNGARYPVWSPDGRRIAFTMVNSEAWGLQIVDTRTGAITNPSHPVVAGLGPFTAAVGWTSNGSLLYEAGMTRRSLWEHSPGERRPTRLLDRRPLGVLDTGLCGAPPRR